MAAQIGPHAHGIHFSLNPRSPSFDLPTTAVTTKAHSALSFDSRSGALALPSQRLPHTLNQQDDADIVISDKLCIDALVEDRHPGQRSLARPRGRTEDVPEERRGELVDHLQVLELQRQLEYEEEAKQVELTQLSKKRYCARQ